MNTKSVPDGAIVVGVDRSASSDLAVDWGVDEATRRHLPLHIVHAYSYRYPTVSVDVGGDLNDEMQASREVADEIVLATVTRARIADPELSVTWSMPPDVTAVAALEAASRTADTVVVGGRNHRAVRELLVGSVATRVASHAYCPVVVVHQRATESAGPSPLGAVGPVVVGVEGPALQRPTLTYAFSAARSRQAPLEVVHGWWERHVEAAPVIASRQPVDWPQRAEDEHVLITQALLDWNRTYPDVQVNVHTTHAHPAEELVRRSAAASLLVVGTSAHRGVGELLGSTVSHAVIRRAHCPVAVIHTPAPAQRAHWRGGALQRRLQPH